MGEGDKELGRLNRSLKLTDDEEQRLVLLDELWDSDMNRHQLALVGNLLLIKIIKVRGLGNVGSRNAEFGQNPWPELPYRLWLNWEETSDRKMDEHTASYGQNERSQFRPQPRNIETGDGYDGGGGDE
ncbi:hypothetical protein Salat_2767000 [Sesamum alatum]|uniref:Uncharacterized protein n=1 Tax=Sesamum alatum TaxID=300844 RepID=A0AAE1XKT6_9LAMI|nr:hypothetical protein Salat_2767000 [Sesamum alatum]